MSSRFHKEESEYTPGDYGDVFCELTGGGSKDGLVLRLDRRFGFVSDVDRVSIYDGKPRVLRWCIYESTYEYQGLYRLCPERGRIYQYEFMGVEGYEKWEWDQYVEEANQAAGSNIPVAAFYGTKGYDECEGEY